LLTCWEYILIEDKKHIAVKYLRGWFVIDLGTSLPIDTLVCLVSPGSINQHELRIIKICRLLKVARMIRFLKLLRKWESASSSKTMRTALRIGKFLSFMLYSCHMAACLWMGQIYITRKCFEQDMVNGECTCHEGWGQRDKTCMNKNWISVYDASILDERSGESSPESKYEMSKSISISISISIHLLCRGRFLDVSLYPYVQVPRLHLLCNRRVLNGWLWRRDAHERFRAPVCARSVSYGRARVCLLCWQYQFALC
jgi:hypothetical protein